MRRLLFQVPFGSKQSIPSWLNLLRWDIRIRLFVLESPVESMNLLCTLVGRRSLPFHLSPATILFALITADENQVDAGVRPYGCDKGFVRLAFGVMPNYPASNFGFPIQINHP